MTSPERFKVLREQAIGELKLLPQPVARLSGPLRSGGEGLEINKARFKLGEGLLRKRGITVFGYDKYADAIQAGYEIHFQEFHVPILRSGYIDSMYFLPNWETSNGASYERNLCGEIGLSVKDITLEELSEFEQDNQKS